MENRAKGTFISFLFGLVIGWWPFRWLTSIGIFASGFLLGSFYNLLVKFLKIMASKPTMECLRNLT